MMLVVAVIGLVTVVIGGSLDSLLPKERLNTAVRNLTATLRNARSEAVGRSLEFLIEYDIEGDRYRLVTPFSREGDRFDVEEMDEEERFAMQWNPLPPGVSLISVTITGNSFSDGRCFARFDPRGAASDHQVVLAQLEYDNYYTVEVMALTGTFKFHRGIFVRRAPDDGDFN
jgi:type II secretory pathway pseudopilin PulG